MGSGVWGIVVGDGGGGCTGVGVGGVAEGVLGVCGCVGSG